MPLFHRQMQKVSLVRPKDFSNEKELQALVEKNLQEIFNCTFVATEFFTGTVHGGRIDTLALSEDGNPVIIEYKVVESSQLITQSLFYLDWIYDHRGDYEMAVQRALQGKKSPVDWSNVRVICIAPEYKKYDLHAVNRMGANIELWQYRYFEDDTFLLEEISKKSGVCTSGGETLTNKNPKRVEAGKKAAMTRLTSEYTIEDHMKKIDGTLVTLVQELREYILSLDESVEEVPNKNYIAYRISQNFVCMELHKSFFYVFLKITADDLPSLPPQARDVRTIGHYGTGDLEYKISSEEHMELAKEYIRISFENIGGM